jgi:uncharacterized integral membrane protein
MKTLILALIVGFWICAIALIAIQNARGVTLRFLLFQSVEIPFGLLLTFGFVLGLVGTALLLPILQGRVRSLRQGRDRYENEFYEE